MFEHLILVTRGRYVMKVGGRTDLLGARQVGLHSRAILEKARLSGGEKVTIRPLNEEGNSSQWPLYAREVFVVVPISEFHDSRLLAATSEGEAVLPSECSVGAEEGENVEINSSYDRLPRNWAGRLIKRCLSGGRYVA